MVSGDLAVQTHGLRKTYRSRTGKQHVAVQGLDLNVPVGGVHGFLGPNGSGKTTSIRMLLGLIHADSGSMEIFGHSIPKQLPTVVARVGAIVESPKFFPSFSGRRNLQLLATGIGYSRRDVDRVLEATSLGDRASDSFKSYSLGMKQRLAIAATLLKSPDLLIFDEPTNGLDPAGIREIRQTMRNLADTGHTVLVSSHILAEVEHIADTVTIIGQGRLLAEGRVRDLVNRTQGSVTARVTDPARALNVLAQQGLSARLDDEQLLVDGLQDPADLTRILAAHDVWVRELRTAGADLESVFLELTKDADLKSTGGVR